MRPTGSPEELEEADADLEADDDTTKEVWGMTAPRLPAAMRQVVSGFARPDGQVVVVCDDGTTWTLSEHSDVLHSKWKQISVPVPGAVPTR